MQYSNLGVLEIGLWYYVVSVIQLGVYETSTNDENKLNSESY